MEKTTRKVTAMETIYTIPVNEAFDACRTGQTSEESGGHECPFCRLYNLTEKNELDLILGASMMEPDVRIKTNEQFFCERHYRKMLTMKNRLGLALMTESHLAELKKSGLSDKMLASLDGSCYICSRIEYSFSRMIETAVLLWAQDPAFRKKCGETSMFCLPHLRRFLEVGKRRLNRREYAAFSEEVRQTAFRYFDSLSDDVSWFCKKFDYRYEAESWGTSKDSVDRALKLLKSDLQY